MEKDRLLDSFGKYLKELRLNRLESCKEVGQAIGLSRFAIYRIENGVNKFFPQPDRMRKLAKYYDVSVYDLLIKSGYNSSDLPQIAHGKDNIEKIGTVIRGICLNDSDTNTWD